MTKDAVKTPEATRPEDAHFGIGPDNPFPVRVEYGGMRYEINGKDVSQAPGDRPSFKHVVTSPPSLFVKRDETLVNDVVTAVQNLFVRGMENQEVLDELNRIRAEESSAPALDLDSPDVTKAREVVKARRDAVVKARRDQAEAQVKAEKSDESSANPAKTNKQ